MLVNSEKVPTWIISLKNWFKICKYDIHSMIKSIHSKKQNTRFKQIISFSNRIPKHTKNEHIILPPKDAYEWKNSTFFSSVLVQTLLLHDKKSNLFIENKEKQIEGLTLGLSFEKIFILHIGRSLCRTVSDILDKIDWILNPCPFIRLNIARENFSWEDWVAMR